VGVGVAEVAVEAEEVVAVAGRMAGLALLGVGVAAGSFLLLGFWEGKLEASGLMLGAILFVLPFLVGGIYLLLRSAEEARAELRLRREREILAQIEAKGEVRMSDLCLDLGLDRPAVESLLRDLVAKGLFAGAIDWKEGILLSAEAKASAGTGCPRCGGELRPAGKGVLRCSYCGSEIYR